MTRPHRRSWIRLSLAIAALGVAAVPLAPAAVAQSGGTPIPLECRYGNGPWLRCQMQVEQVGAHWILLIEDRRLEFRHDGTGTVRMQADGAGWRTVNSRWDEDTSLCWDGVCARGDIPLD